MNEIQIPIGSVNITGDLVIPGQARGVIVFAHGSGSSRYSPRNRKVASALQQSGFGTLLMDLLTPQEERADALTAEFRFDIQLLAARLAGATDWLSSQESTRNYSLGYFGASTGAAAALIAAAQRPDKVDAVVSRGGRPDLAGSALSKVSAPTLLIVGAMDKMVIDLNRAALDQMSCESKIVRVPGATHLFEEPGALEHVSQLASDWFGTHLKRDERAA